MRTGANVGVPPPGTAEREEDLPDVNEHSCRYLEIDAAGVVRLSGSGQIEIGELDLVRAIVGQIKQRVANNGIVLQLCLVAIPENEQGAGLGYHRLGRRDYRCWLRLRLRFRLNEPRAGSAVTGAATVENRGTAFIVVVCVVIGIYFRLDDHYLRVRDAETHSKWKEAAVKMTSADEDWRLGTTLKAGIKTAVTKASMSSEAVGPEGSYTGRDAGCKRSASSKSEGSNRGGNAVNLGIERRRGGNEKQKASK